MSKKVADTTDETLQGGVIGFPLMLLYTVMKQQIAKIRMSAAGASCFGVGTAGRRKATSFSDRSLRTPSGPWTVTNSRDSRRCSIAPTPTCLTGYSASAIRRQNMIMT